MIPRAKFLLLVLLFGFAGLAGCESDVANRVGVSSGGLIVAIKQFSGNAGLSADGASQATIRVEVFTNAGQTVDGAQVFLTTTLGTLGETNLTTTAGVALTTLTAGTVPGTAFVVASVENVSATIAVQIVNISTEAG
ncbi:MAG: invasin domain 3-containing protein [Nitrospinales bacterium]